MSEPVNVVCMKWGDRYRPEYVNRLHAGVKRHLRRAFRFVCFTDDGAGLDPDIDVRPLPTLALPAAHRDSRWTKVALFKAPLADLSGQTLFLDLDLVVVGPLDDFFEYPGRFVAVRDGDLFRFKPIDLLRPEQRRLKRVVGNTSVFRWRIGEFTDIPERFERDPGPHLARHRLSQQFVSQCLLDRDQLDYWPRGWCVSFKNDCVPRGLASFWRNPGIPEGARLVLFAGDLKQHEVLAGGGQRWYRRIGPTPWLDQHWRDAGAADAASPRGRPS